MWTCCLQTRNHANLSPVGRPPNGQAHVYSELEMFQERHKACSIRPHAFWGLALVCCHALGHVDRLSHVGAAGKQTSYCVESLAAGFGPAQGLGGCVGCEHCFARHVGGALCTAFGRQECGSAGCIHVGRCSEVRVAWGTLAAKCHACVVMLNCGKIVNCHTRHT